MSVKYDDLYYGENKIECEILKMNEIDWGWEMLVKPMNSDLYDLYNMPVNQYSKYLRIGKESKNKYYIVEMKDDCFNRVWIILREIK